MKTKIVIAAALAALSAAGCAAAPGDIAPTYTATTRWQGQSCQQLAAEQARIGVEVERVTGKQLAKRRSDQTMTGVGLIVFWPALIAMPLTKNHKEELARLKGEYEAVQRAQEAQRCRSA